MRPAAWQLAAPDLSAWRRGNTGIEGVWRFDSARPGRDVLVTALVHGNELCGAIALCHALQAGLRPRRGSLTLALCNLDAFDAFDAGAPDAARFIDEDFNRLWGTMPWKGHRSGVEHRRVLQLQPVVERSTWLLDLHSMHEPGPPLGLVGPLRTHADQAMTLGAPEMLVADAGHRAGCRLRDHGAYGDPSARDRFALLVECGFHGSPESVEVALDMLARFTLASACLDLEDIPDAWWRPRPARQRLLTVTDTITVREGEPPSFARGWRCGELIAQPGTLLGWTGGEPMRTPYADCVLIMPSLVHAHPGATLVRLAHEATPG